MQDWKTIPALAVAALLLAACSHKSEEVMVKPAPMPEASMSEEKAMMEEGAKMMEEGTMMKEEGAMMKDEGAMMKEEGAAEMVENDAASNCIANGGTLVSWPSAEGDAEEACRREDGVEYRLTDAAYFEN